MARLVVQHPDGRTEEHELSSELSIGRAEGNDLILTEGGVSRRHARLSVRGDEVLVEDAASANGTFVDGQKIDAPTPLAPGSELVIGSYSLRLANGAGKARRPAGKGVSPGSELAPVRRQTSVMPTVKGGAGKRAAMVASEPAGIDSGPQLRGLTGPWANQVFRVDRKLVIGRTGAVEVLIEDDSVSRRHAEVARTSDGYVVRDLGSANGTLVNGEPVAGDEVVLKPGDVVQVGVVELVFEVLEPEKLDAPVRRRDRGPSRLAPESAEHSLSLNRSKVMLLAGVGVGALVLVGVIAKVMAPEPPPPSALTPGTPGTPQVPVDPRQALKQEVDRLLAACRTYAAADLMNPSWEKAEAACQRAVEKNPIDADAVQLLARVRRDKDSHASYLAAEKAMARNADDEALEQLQQIATDSPYYLRAKPRALEAAAGVKKRAAEDCKRYTARSFWKEAQASCQAYMRIACQDMSKDDLHPPPGEKLKLKGKLGKNEWRPADPMLRNLLQARLELEPRAALWECPELEILKRGRETSDAKEELEKVFKERFKDRSLVMALMDYWRGKGNDAITRLQKLVDDPDKTTLHGVARELLKEISQVHQLFGLGQTHLKADAPEKAVDPFREALALDRQLMKDQAEPYPSWYARGIRQDMASASYRRGRLLADERQNYRDACRIWKSGFEFSTGHMDLLKAMNFCSSKAKAAFDNASSCEALEQVLDFAVPHFSDTVPGDGYTEAVKDKKVKLNCL